MLEIKRNPELIDRKVIEDIKAELTQNYVNDNPNNFRYTTVQLSDVLNIIDKHTKGDTDAT